MYHSATRDIIDLVMTQANDPGRRSSPRLPMQAMVTYRLDGQEYGNLAADVSTDGIFIRTFMPPEVGTRLDVTISLPPELGGLRIELKGVVRRRVDSDDPRANGMGVQFTSVNATDPDTVRFIVSKFIGIKIERREHEDRDLLEEFQTEQQMDDGDTKPSS